MFIPALLLAAVTAAAPPLPSPIDDSVPAASAPTCSAGVDALPRSAPRVVAGVVSISTTRTSKDEPSDRDVMLNLMFGVPIPREERVLGSGVVLDRDGTIVTNHHVIARATSIHIGLPDGRSLPARLIGTDALSDIAVLHVDDPQHALQPIPVGNSDGLTVGQVVLAVSNPFGIGTTVTMGVVSALHREDIAPLDSEEFIQTDAAMNPGSSGGALVDLCGSLVGIDTAIATSGGGNEGVGFAVPARTMQRIVEVLRAHGRVVRGSLGAEMQDATPVLASALGAPGAAGVVVSDVEPDGPAARAHIDPGEIITSVDGKPVGNAARLSSEMASRGPGARVTLRVRGRHGVRQVALRLQELPASPDEMPVKAPAHPGVGVTAVDLSPALRDQLDVPHDIDAGAVVTAVHDDSPASKAGLEPGDVIIEVGGTPVGNAKETLAALRHAKGAVLLRIIRDGNRRFVGFTNVASTQ